MKKVLSILLTLALALGLFAAMPLATAAEDVEPVFAGVVVVQAEEAEESVLTFLWDGLLSFGLGILFSLLGLLFVFLPIPLTSLVGLIVGGAGGLIKLLSVFNFILYWVLL